MYCAEDGAETTVDETDGATAALVEVVVGAGAVYAELEAVETTAVELLDGATNVLVEEVLRVDDGTAIWVEDGRVLEVEVEVVTADEMTVDDGAVVEVEDTTLLTTAVLLVEVELPCEIDTL